MNPLEIRNIFKNLDTKSLYGCDCSAANIFLYREKEQISFEYARDVFFRFYGVERNANYAKCGFPIPAKNAPQDYLYDSINYLLGKYKNVGFCLCTQEQKNLIDETFARRFKNKRVNWKTDRAESDYVYLRENLASLPGQAYQKKKNHVSHFLKAYENQWKFSFFNAQNVAENQKRDIFDVAEKWFNEKNGETQPALQDELEIIKSALENFENLDLSGGILYVRDEPVAMTIASAISDDAIDINFEKSLNEPAKNGAYAAINQFFAKKCDRFLYINREEDLGVPGLRKAKLSYKPQIILDKFSGTVEKT